jgi:hypothetical protein
MDHLVSLLAEVARRAQCEPGEIEWYSWPQTFNSTAGPNGGAGGNTPTTFQVFAFDAPGLKLRYCAGKWRPWNGECRQWWGS